MKKCSKHYKKILLLLQLHKQLIVKKKFRAPAGVTEFFYICFTNRMESTDQEKGKGFFSIGFGDELGVHLYRFLIII